MDDGKETWPAVGGGGDGVLARRRVRLLPPLKFELCGKCRGEVTSNSDGAAPNGGMLDVAAGDAACAGGGAGRVP